MTTVHDVRKVALIMTVGRCDAIKMNAISIEEAEHYLFSPRTMKIFDNDPELREIIHIATELDDLKQLVPTELGPAIANVKRAALEKMPACAFAQPP
ncbi:MAG: hypothetical protein JWO04_5168 [Gammaproteobacteria bacterium]|nr:hypothetical protein [Gammaproteobacteria bacterium]